MMKGVAVARWLVVVSGVLLLGGCTETGGSKAELNSQIQQIKASLEATKNERDLLEQDAKRLKQDLDQAESALAGTTKTNTDLQGRVQDLTKSRDELSTKVDELGTARTNLQKRVDELTTSCGGLEKQVAALTQARDAARADAASAQAKIDQLTEKLKTQTQQMVELQDQMATIRSVLQQLQQKLE
jgi:chromosome segregation ATPase